MSIDSSLTSIIVVLITQAGLFVMMIMANKNKASEKQVGLVEKAQDTQRQELKELSAKLDNMRELLGKCDRDKAILEVRLSVLERMRSDGPKRGAKA